jgi:phage shock protein A
MSSQADVESELAALKAGKASSAPQAIEAADGSADVLAPEAEKKAEGDTA